MASSRARLFHGSRRPYGKPVPASNLRLRDLKNRHLRDILSQNNSGTDNHRPYLLRLETVGAGRGRAGGGGWYRNGIVLVWDDGKGIQGFGQGAG